MGLSLKKKSCQTLSNALNNSRKTPRLTTNDGSASDVSKMPWGIEMSWCAPELAGLNPDWLLLRRLFLLSKQKSELKNDLLKDFSIDR